MVEGYIGWSSQLLNSLKWRNRGESSWAWNSEKRNEPRERYTWHLQNIIRNVSDWIILIFASARSLPGMLKSMRYGWEKKWWHDMCGPEREEQPLPGEWVVCSHGACLKSIHLISPKLLREHISENLTQQCQWSEYQSGLDIWILLVLLGYTGGCPWKLWGWNRDGVLRNPVSHWMSGAFVRGRGACQCTRMCVETSWSWLFLQGDTLLFFLALYFEWFLAR